MNNNFNGNINIIGKYTGRSNGIIIGGVMYKKNITTNCTVNRDTFKRILSGIEEGWFELYEPTIDNIESVVKKELDKIAYDDTEVRNQISSLQSEMGNTGKEITQIKAGIEQVSSQIDEIEKQEVRTETLNSAVETYVNNAIDNGKMANLTIANKSINASEKISNGTITQELFAESVKFGIDDGEITEEKLSDNLKDIIKEASELNKLDTKEIKIDNLDKIDNSEQVTISDDDDNTISFIDSSGADSLFTYFYIFFDKAIEFTMLNKDDWCILLACDECVIAVQISVGTGRIFTKSSKIELGTIGIKKESAILSNNTKIKIETDDSVNFNIYVKTGGIDDYLLYMTVDTSSIDKKYNYKQAFGVIAKVSSTPREIVKNVKSSMFFSSFKELINSLKNRNTEKIVDLFIFMGQSNMSGIGEASEATVVPSGYGYEFRAISDPTRLYDVIEPFGRYENNSESGVSESRKRGSMVSAFIKAYYEGTKVPIVAVSCSKTGSSVNWWQPEGDPLNDAINRHNIAKEWLIANGYTVRHDFMVWCQGESDGDNGMTGNEYKTKIRLIVEEMKANGIEKCCIVRIGEYNSTEIPNKYDEIISAQTEICKEDTDFMLIGTKFAGMRERGLMKDNFHYLQQGYNEQGEEAGNNAAFFVNNIKEPFIYDVKYDNLYYSKK